MPVKKSVAGDATSVLKHAEIEKIIVPQIGLSDGIVHQLYEKYKEKQLVVKSI